MARPSRVFGTSPSLILPLCLILTLPASAAVPPRYDLRWETPRPSIMALNPSGNLVVSQYPITRIRTFSTSGSILDEWGTAGPGPGQLFNITALAVDAAGDVYVGTTGNSNAVQKFSAGGTYLSTLALAGTGPGEVAEASGLAVGPSGDVIVTDRTRNLILRFSSAGTFLGDFGLPGGSAGTPRDVAVDPSGRIWVMDGGNDDVYRFSSTGVFEGTLLSALGPVLSIGIAADGGILVGSSGYFAKHTAAGTEVWRRPYSPGGFYVGDIAETNGGLLFALVDGGDHIHRYRPYIGPEPTVNYTGPDRILLHVTPVPGSNPCRAGEIDNCLQANARGLTATSSAGPWNFAYLMVGRRDFGSLAGLQIGITYQSGNPTGREDGEGLDIFSWIACSSLQFASISPAWPSPGSGNLITWSDPQCQVEKTVIAGYFYVGAYGVDALSLTTHPSDGLVKLAPCGGGEYVFPSTNLGYAVFSPGATLPGCNPCDPNGCGNAPPPPPPVPVESTTWSAIKALQL